MFDFLQQCSQYLTYSIPGAPPCHFVFDDNIKYLMHQQLIQNTYDDFIPFDLMMMNDPFASLFMPPHIINIIEQILDLECASFM
tara:strand:+ start:174 stop:425 length:252 start_codon:yes stop_codon:yes gene_type:complete